MEPDAVHAWRRLSVLPLCLLVGAVLALFVTGWAVDASSLEQRDDSWGFAAGAMILTVVGAPALFLALGCAVLPRSFDGPAVPVRSAWAGAVTSAASGIGLAVLAVPPMGSTPADTAFGAVCAALAAALLVPVALCARRAGRQRASAAAS